MDDIQLGDRVKDRISGFEGIATGRIEYIANCDRIQISPKVDKDGKVPDSIWVDVYHVEVLEREVIKRPVARRNASSVEGATALPSGPAPG